MNYDNVIIAPYVTEKTETVSSQVNEKRERYTLRVRTDANKESIKQALYKIYKVTAIKINVLNVPGKNKRFRNSLFKQPSWKKAIVTLKSGETIDFAKKA